MYNFPLNKLFIYSYKEKRQSIYVKYLFTLGTLSIHANSSLVRSHWVVTQHFFLWWDKALRGHPMRLCKLSFADQVSLSYIHLACVADTRVTIGHRYWGCTWEEYSPGEIISRLAHFVACTPCNLLPISLVWHPPGRPTLSMLVPNTTHDQPNAPSLETQQADNRGEMKLKSWWNWLVKI